MFTQASFIWWHILNMNKKQDLNAFMHFDLFKHDD